MSTTTEGAKTRHPDHDHEQSVISRAYSAAHIAHANRVANLSDTSASSRAAYQALSAQRQAVLSEWRDVAGRRLVFGRLDKIGFSMHLGPTAIKDDDGNVFVANWTTKAVEDYYLATKSAPRSVILKRAVTETRAC